jgi:Cytochrome P460
VRVGRRLVLASFLVVMLTACGGGSDPVAEPTSPEPAPTAPPEPATTEPDPTTQEETTTEAAPPPPEAPPGVPGYVAGYRDWVQLNREPIPPRDADPHLGTKNVYASQDRRANGRFPYGTIVVKDANRPGKDFIGLIAIMRKERGADPAHNDWVFVEYTRERRGDRFREIASGAVCWSCHMGALDSDYVFTR